MRTRRSFTHRRDQPRCPAPSSLRAGRKGDAGFSLIEVLGAIAILGVWFAVIAEIAMVGLRNEGRSQRELLASLVADNVLSEIEIDLLQGQLPEMESDEIEENDYIIRIDVEPYTLELPEPYAGSPVSPAGAQFTGPFQLLAGDAPDAHNPLVSIRVEVAWMEGHDETSVVRYTFGVDLSQAQGALSALERPGAGPEEDALEEDDEDFGDDLSDGGEL